MKVSAEQRRFDVVDRIARGASVADALRASGYSEGSVGHMGSHIVGGKAFRRTMREFAEALSPKIENLAPAELEMLRVGKAPVREMCAALRAVWAAFNAKTGGKQLKALTGGQSLTKESISKYWSPERQQ